MIVPQSLFILANAIPNGTLSLKQLLTLNNMQTGTTQFLSRKNVHKVFNNLLLDITNKHQGCFLLSQLLNNIWLTLTKTNPSQRGLQTIQMNWRTRRLLQQYSFKHPIQGLMFSGVNEYRVNIIKAVDRKWIWNYIIIPQIQGKWQQSHSL